MNTDPDIAAPKPSFDTFYREVFLPEHRHPANVALHMAGTMAGLAFVAAVLAAPWAWWPALLLFPAVHAVPGLIGHSLLERSSELDDSRWRRTDYPGWWFIAGNHRMTAERLLSPWGGVAAPSAATPRHSSPDRRQPPG